MSSEQQVAQTHLVVRNIGGINEASVEFDPGVTILAGENATNRTSLLQSIMAALGSDNVSIKGDAKTASLELDIAGESYTRTLKREGNGIVDEGNPHLDDPTLADLFAFLLESNEARRSVTLNDDLRSPCQAQYSLVFANRESFRRLPSEGVSVTVSLPRDRMRRWWSA